MEDPGVTHPAPAAKHGSAGALLLSGKARGTADCGKVPPAGAVASSTGQHPRGRAHEGGDKQTLGCLRRWSHEWQQRSGTALRDGGFSPTTSLLPIAMKQAGTNKNSLPSRFRREESIRGYV